MQKTFGLINPEELLGNTLIVGDVVEVLNQFPAESIDMLYTDEGYTDLDNHRKIGTTTRLKVSEGSSMKWYETIGYKDLIPQYRKILKDGHHWFCWRPSFNTESWKNWDLLLSLEYGLLIENGFSLAKVLPAGKDFTGMGYTFRSRHENLMFCIKSIKDKVQLNDLTLPDIIDEHWVHPRSKERIHDSQKPLEVARKIIESSTKPNDIIIEAFAGSFQSGQANHLFDLKRNIIGIEKNEEIVVKTVNYFSNMGIPLNMINFKELVKSS